MSFPHRFCFVSWSNSQEDVTLNMVPKSSLLESNVNLLCNWDWLLQSSELKNVRPKPEIVQPTGFSTDIPLSKI